MPRTAAGQNAPVAGEPVEMHEAAAVLDRLAAFPAQGFELLRCQRIGDDDIRECRGLLEAHARQEVRVAVGGVDDLVR